MKTYQETIYEFTVLAASSYEKFLKDNPDWETGIPDEKEIWISSSRLTKMAFEIIKLRDEVAYLRELNLQALGYDRHQDIKA